MFGVLCVENREEVMIDFFTAVEYMDDEIRVKLEWEMVGATEQEFFTAYEYAHEAKFGELWELSKANPVI